MRLGRFQLGVRTRDGEGVGFDPALIALSLAITIVCTLPLWLTGALAVQMRAELGFSIVALGGAVAVFRVAGAASSVPLGRLADRLGPVPALRIAAGMAAASGLGIAAFAHDWLVLVAFLALSGASNVLGQTAANLTLVRTVRAGRQGIAFGVKQSALPAGSLVAGLAVPLLALTIGWRWAFVLAAVLALAVAAVVPANRTERYGTSSGASNRVYGRRPLVLLALGLFFGMGAAGSLTTYIVESATVFGFAEAAAGLLLTFGSALSIGARLIAGARADQRGGRHLHAVGLMLLAGSVGYVLIAVGTPAAVLVGAALAFPFAWGFNGVFWLAIVRLNQATPASATGLLMPGGMLGGVAGPLTFGLLVDTFSYQAAWLTAGGWGLLAGLCMLLGRWLLRIDLGASDAAGAPRPAAGTTS
ncbi:MFS transporter [Egibacter rhizosphaerae]|uniref:MFS transporter n=1 Tax=Egibacter rhizosphaerae TaxID=1670831 RepID=A0A411YHD2_9ACTN|nr:MFS transporter [Egibacter rhizosphaerae]QBI20482.1 MFS transporter [Egibacter rhizosphaerae]